MKRTTTAAFAAAAALVASYAPAGNAAGTAVRGYAEAVVEVIGSDGAPYAVYVAALGAGDNGTGPASVAVQVARCDARRCAPPVANGQWRASTTVAGDLATASLAGSWGGAPLTGTWRADAGDPGLVGLQAWRTPTVRAGRQRVATATLELVGLRCRARVAVVANEVRVSADDPYASRPVPVPAPLRPRGDVAPRCA